MLAARRSRQLDASTCAAEEARAEALRLVAQVAGELRSEHALRVAREVLDVGRLLDQAARMEAFDDQRLELRPRRVQRCGVAGGTAADDHDLLDAIGRRARR